MLDEDDIDKRAILFAGELIRIVFSRWKITFTNQFQELKYGRQLLHLSS